MEGSTVKQIIVGMVSRELQAPEPGTRVRFPLIQGKAKRKLRINNEDLWL